MGDQTSIPETYNRLLETIFFDKNDHHLSTDSDERSTRYQAEFHLKTQ